MITETKQTLRQIWRTRRRDISPLRRSAAKQAFTADMTQRTIDCKAVLSYASFDDELSTTVLNSTLSIHNQLVLPKVQRGQLILYRVNHLKTQLKENRWGIREPIPDCCSRVLPEQVDFIIVPGIAFDNRGARLGYGRGYYDRLLSQISPKVCSTGVGFTEQLSLSPLPTLSHDALLGSVQLF